MIRQEEALERRILLHGGQGCLFSPKNLSQFALFTLGVTIIMDNVGSLHYGPFVDQNRDDEEWVNQLLIVPVLRVIHAALPSMLDRGRGTIINVAVSQVHSRAESGYFRSCLMLFYAKSRE